MSNISMATVGSINHLGYFKSTTGKMISILLYPEPHYYLPTFNINILYVSMLKQPIFSPLPSFVYPSACCIAVDHNDFVTVKTLQMFCFAPFLHTVLPLNLILNFLFHFRAYIAERIDLKNSAKDLWPKDTTGSP